MKIALVLFAIATTAAYEPHEFGNRLRFAIYTPRSIGGAYWTDQEGYSGIIREKFWTIAEERDRIMEWAETHNVTKEAREVFEAMDRRREQIKWNVTKLAILLPHALERFGSIVEDVSQTHEEQSTALREIEADDPELFRVIRFAVEQFMSRFPPTIVDRVPHVYGPRGEYGPYGPGDFDRIGPHSHGPYSGRDGGYEKPWLYPRGRPREKLITLLPSEW
ncbi:hypothetical protein OSTOST_12329 [Ostertagia ostertagi]